MNPNESTRACTSCKSEELIGGKTVGYFGTQISFISPSAWFGYYRLKAFACSNCGHVGHYLYSKELETFREKERR